jgi:hypothetical protein
MNSDLDSLIKELEAGTWQAPNAPRPAQVEEVTLRPESLDTERRFNQLHAKLFPYLGRKVRTPAGPGTLLQVFVERVTVLLDSELSQSSFFRPAEIEPITWELP